MATDGVNAGAIIAGIDELEEEVSVFVFIMKK